MQQPIADSIRADTLIRSYRCATCIYGGAFRMPTCPLTGVHKHIIMGTHCNLHCLAMFVVYGGIMYVHTWSPSLILPVRLASLSL